MLTTDFFRKQQEAGQIADRVATFFDDFQIGSLLNKAGIKKLRGAKPRALFTAIFLLPFIGANFYRGIVQNDSLGFKKDAAYALLKNPRHNWRKFLLGLARLTVRFMEVLTSERREKVFVIDDSVYDRHRSKKVELLSWVFDHVLGKSVKGFKLLALGWGDGVSFVPLDFVLCAATDPNKRVCDITKEMDHHCCGYRRRREALRKATDLLLPLLKRTKALGIWADYLLMDSWFAFPSVLADLHALLPVICRAKDLPNVRYRFRGEELRLGRLYHALRKRPGRAKYLASAVVESQGLALKVVFVRHREHKKQWVALLSTDTALDEREIVRLYGRRWDIEPCFKVLKNNLNLEREMESRDFDALIGHITVVLCRYIFLAFEQRCHDDPRTLGSLFYACCEEQKDLGFLEALGRLLASTLDKARQAGQILETASKAFVELLVAEAVDMMRNKWLFPQNMQEITNG